MRKGNFWCFLFFVLAGLFLSGLIFGGCEFQHEDNHTSPPPSPPPHRSSAQARHLILFIGDGMSLANEIATSRYLYGSDLGLVWHSFPYQAYVATWDVNSYNAYAWDLNLPAYDEADFDPLVGYNPTRGGNAPYPIDPSGDLAYLFRSATDSASAATAMATGLKTDSGNISWLRNDPPDGALLTIAEMLRMQKSRAIGIVSSVPVSHATPATFVSHNTDRGNYYQIADEIINQIEPEVVIGGGHPDWNGSYVTREQLDYLRGSQVYQLVERVPGEEGGLNLIAKALSLPEGKKLFGLFGGGGGNFEPPIPIDSPGSPGFLKEKENPSLAEATKTALMVLSKNPKGFFLMVESGDIDWANHSNDFAMMIGTVFSLEEAVRSAVEFIETPGDEIDWTNTLLIVTADHATGGMRLNDNLPLSKGDLPQQIGGYYPDGEVTYLTNSHTNELVPLYAKGTQLKLFQKYAGKWYPESKILDNSQLFLVMCESAGLKNCHPISNSSCNIFGPPRRLRSSK